MLGAATVSDGFLYLLLQREAGFSPGLFPLLYVGTSACYLALAVPAGGLADRIGRQRAFLAGYGLLAAAYAATMQPGIGPAGGGGLPPPAGRPLRADRRRADGVRQRPAAPGAARRRGLALITTAASLARLLGSVVFGALWTRYGAAATAVPVFLTALATAIAVAAVLLRDADGKANHDGSA